MTVSIAPQESASEIHVLYMYILIEKGCIVERENGKSLLKRWHPFTSPVLLRELTSVIFFVLIFRLDLSNCTLKIIPTLKAVQTLRWL